MIFFKGKKKPHEKVVLLQFSKDNSKEHRTWTGMGTQSAENQTRAAPWPTWSGRGWLCSHTISFPEHNEAQLTQPEILWLETKRVSFFLDRWKDQKPFIKRQSRVRKKNEVNT